MMKVGRLDCTGNLDWEELFIAVTQCYKNFSYQQLGVPLVQCTAKCYLHMKVTGSQIGVLLMPFAYLSLIIVRNAFWSCVLEII